MKTFEQLSFNNSFARLPDHFFSRHEPEPLHNDFLIHFNPLVAELIGIDPAEAQREDLLDLFMQRRSFPGFEPLAQCYAGHQFGQFVPRLGDGRALLMGQFRDADNRPWDLQLKGAGPTLYSRGSDGRAVLRSSIREYLCSAAMHGLHIPTTHALFLCGSEEEVFREQIEPGAMVLRVAPGHIRFGTFEYYFYSQRYDDLRTLLDYTLEHYFPHVLETDNPCLGFFNEVVASTAGLIARWQAAGFAHGVMNSDNMSIHGITLDYGPFGFIEQYDPGYICNHSDHGGRYAFGQQPEIGLFNLSCLAQALLPLLHDNPETATGLAKAALQQYQPQFVRHYARLMRHKLGLVTEDRSDRKLVTDLLSLLAANRVDYSLFFRTLSREQTPANIAACRDLFLQRDDFDPWFARYHHRLQAENRSMEQRSEQMKQVNPEYILRNYMAEIAIRKAQDEKDYSEIDKLMTVLQDPFAEHPDMAHYAGQPPDWAQQISISCSS